LLDSLVHGRHGVLQQHGRHRSGGGRGVFS
jgi:hypothetical protein